MIRQQEDVIIPVERRMLNEPALDKREQGASAGLDGVIFLIFSLDIKQWDQTHEEDKWPRQEHPFTITW